MTEQGSEESQLSSAESRILGDRFRRICDSFGLEEEDVELIDSSLAEFEGDGGIMEKISALSEKVIDKPDEEKENILSAMVEISHSYMDIHPISPFGKKARNAGLN